VLFISDNFIYGHYNPTRNGLLVSYPFLSLLGGSCVETDLSAKVSVHVALATQPTALLAKPGMGIDEALQIMRNEMNRALLLS